MTNLQRPTSDFFAVRDGRRSPWYSHEVDLSAARTDTPSGDLILQIAGNSFYIDRAPDVGNASIQFQDTSFDRAMLPIYAGPGFIANAPFTQIKITNIAQPGKVLRIFYGVDIDFQPGTSSEIVLSGVVNTSTVISGVVQTTNVFPIKTVPRNLIESGFQNDANTAPIAGYSTWIAPAFNNNGLTIVDASIRQFDAANILQYFIAAPSLPLFIGSGHVVLMSQVTSPQYYGANLASPIFIPAGLGIYFYSSAGSVNNCVRTMSYVQGPVT